MMVNNSFNIIKTNNLLPHSIENKNNYLCRGKSIGECECGCGHPCNASVNVCVGGCVHAYKCKFNIILQFYQNRNSEILQVHVYCTILK